MSPRKRGLAAASASTRARVAAKGGRVAQAQGKFRRFTPESARDAALKRHTAASAADEPLEANDAEFDEEL